MKTDTTPIEELAKKLYEQDGFNYACLATDEAWRRDREDVRNRYRQIAWERMNARTN